MNWISVKDGLPDKINGEYLVYTINNTWMVGQYEGDGSWFLYNKGSKFHNSEVTHWCEVTSPDTQNTNLYENES